MILSKVICHYENIFQALGKVIEYSTEIAGQTNYEATRLEMISVMKQVILTSSEFLTTAKILSLDPLQAQSRAHLNQATRFEKEYFLNTA